MTQNQAIEEIIESAIFWISEDADNPAKPPEEWQEILPLLRAAPEMLAFVKEIVTFGGKYSYLNCTPIVPGAYRVLRLADGREA